MVCPGERGGALVGTLFPPTGWILHSSGVSACNSSGARLLLVHALPSYSSPPRYLGFWSPSRGAHMHVLGPPEVEALAELGRRPPQRRTFWMRPPAEQGQDGLAI